MLAVPLLSPFLARGPVVHHRVVRRIRLSRVDVRLQPGQYLTPGVRVRGPAGVGLYTFFQAPVYRYVNEAQLAPSYGWLVGLTRSF